LLPNRLNRGALFIAAGSACGTLPTPEVLLMIIKRSKPHNIQDCRFITMDNIIYGNKLGPIAWPAIAVASRIF
jgi:hypothetical protein